jgi:thiosulfate/3-mercaptopyruvate sulfurtransferase
MCFTTLIDVAALRGLPAGCVLLDCRFDLTDPSAGLRAYRAGHIPGARFADLNRDLSAPVTAASGRHPLPSAAALTEFFTAAGIANDTGDGAGGTQVVAYDAANGSFAARAWWLLNWLGHREVAVLDGGYQAWVAGGGPVESGDAPQRAAAVCFTPRQRPDAVMSTGEVLHGLDDPTRLLVDARAPERFSGAVEPLDPVAGHVPGAVNHPFTHNLDPAGRFLSAAELRRRWLTRLAGTPPQGMIAMCGSGVTACHNLLAMAAAGLPGAKLYAGSWSEWIRSPDRPVARGSSP